MKHRKLILVCSIFMLFNNNIPIGNALQLIETQNGQIILVKKSSEFTIQLKSTYWQLVSIPTNSKVVRIGSELIESVKPGPSAPIGCQHPGSGCGKITWKFRAVSIGTSIISATRASCGEALRCTEKDQNFKVTIKVIK